MYLRGKKLSPVYQKTTEGVIRVELFFGADLSYYAYA
jgi:hypothetical protein